MTNLLQALTVWTPLVIHPVKDEATHELLRGTLAERDPLVRERALEALALVRNPADLALVRKQLEAPWEATRQQAARTAEALGVALGSREAAAAAATRRMGAERRVPSVPEGLRSGDPVVVAGTLRRMDAVAVRDAAAAVLRKLDDPELVVQEEAVRAVGRGAVVEAVPRLLKKLVEGDEGLRRASAEALAVVAGKVDKKELVPVVVGRLERDESSLVRQAAGRALVAWHDEVSREALRKLLRSERGVTRQAAAQALGEWGDASLAGEIETLLTDAEDLVARTAAEALGRLKHPGSKGPLLAELPGRRPFVQEKLAWALGELRATEAVGALTKLLGTTQETLKVELIRALGKTGDKGALPALRQVLQSISVNTPMPSTRVAALEALQTAGDKVSILRAIALVTQRVVPPPPGGGPSHDDDAVRVAAMRFLVALGDKATGAALQAAFKEMAPRDIRPAVAETFTALTGRAYVPVPDQSHKPHFVESLVVPDFFQPPLPGVREGRRDGGTERGGEGGGK